MNLVYRGGLLVFFCSQVSSLSLCHRKSKGSGRMASTGAVEPAPESGEQHAAPMYITIGPPLAGKTTWLRQKGEVVDVAIDDQPGVYVPMPSKVFYMDLTDAAKDMLRSRQVYGKSLLSRVENEKEHIAVVKWCHGALSKEDFRSTMAELYASEPAERVATLVSIYEESLSNHMSQSLGMPVQTDLFVVEAIFRPHEETGLTGITSALLQLEEVPVDKAVAWGNTNVRPSDFTAALQLANKQHRPVEFVVYDPFPQGSEGTSLDGTVALEGVGIDGLLDRNMNRYLNTGRYVPVRVLLDMNQRTQELLRQVKNRRHARGTGDAQTLQHNDVDAILKEMGLNGKV